MMWRSESCNPVIFMCQFDANVAQQSEVLLACGIQVISDLSKVGAGTCSAPNLGAVFDLQLLVL